MTEGPLFPLGGPQSDDRAAASNHPQMSASSYPTLGAPPSAAVSQSGADGSTRKVGIIAATIVAVTGIAAAAYVFTSRSTDTTPEPTPNKPTPVDVGSQPITPVQPAPVAPPPPPAAPPQLVTATVVGTCDEGGSCGVKQRAAPLTAAPRMYPNDLLDGSVVVLACRAIGDVRSSAGHGSSSVWYRLDNGAFVNSVYLDADSSSAPAC